MTTNDNQTVRLDYLYTGDFGTFSFGSRVESTIEDVTYLEWNRSLDPSRGNRNLRITKVQTKLLEGRPRVEIGIFHGRLTNRGEDDRNVEYDCE